MRVLTLVAVFLAPVAFAGAWGTGSFDNDDALDWLIELEKSTDSSVLSAAFKDVEAKAKYVEAPACAAALAAAEVVAAAKGKPSKDLPAEADAWLKRVKPAIDGHLAKRARAAVTVCRDGKNSELREVWAESKDFARWLNDTASLLSRL